MHYWGTVAGNVYEILIYEPIPIPVQLYKYTETKTIHSLFQKKIPVTLVNFIAHTMIKIKIFLCIASKHTSYLLLPLKGTTLYKVSAN